MTTNTITQLTDPQGFSPDPLTDLLRSGARCLIEQAVEAELSVLLEAYASEKTDCVFHDMWPPVPRACGQSFHDMWPHP